MVIPFLTRHGKPQTKLGFIRSRKSYGESPGNAVFLFASCFTLCPFLFPSSIVTAVFRFKLKTLFCKRCLRNLFPDILFLIFCGHFHTQILPCKLHSVISPCNFRRFSAFFLTLVLCPISLSYHWWQFLLRNTSALRRTARSEEAQPQKPLPAPFPILPQIRHPGKVLMPEKL